MLLNGKKTTCFWFKTEYIAEYPLNTHIFKPVRDKKCYLVLSKCNVFAFIYEHVGVALRRNKSLQSFPDYCLWTRMKNEFSCSNFRSF